MKRMRHLSIFLCLMLPIAVYAQDERFGIVEGFWFPEVTCDLGVGWERIIFNWEQHQPTNPTDWHTLNIDDRWLKSANACQREVVGLLKHTPDWATAGLTGAGVPLGLHLSVDDPSNYWANFVRQTAFYYAPRGVHRFIVWNEPDISADTYGFEFEGEVEDYAHLLKSAYLAAKQGNPSAQIHLAGTTYWHDVNAGRALYLERLLEVLAKDAEAVQHDYYFDVVSLHIISAQIPSSILWKPLARF
ncbi:MAG UNVERIFIED_CONTAM: LIM domain-binding protein [Anaerolineae bacterium]